MSLDPIKSKVEVNIPVIKGNEEEDIVRRVALRVLKDLAMGFGGLAFMSFFITLSPAAFLLLSAGIIMIISANVFMHEKIIYIEQECGQLEKTETPEALALLEKRRKVLNYLAYGKAAMKCMQEVFFAAACIGLAAPFMLPSCFQFYSIFGAVSVSINAGLRMWGVSLRKECEELKKLNAPEDRPRLEMIETILNYLPYAYGIGIANLFQGTAGVLIHEEGHVAAVLKLYDHVFPSIQINMDGGLTSWGRQWNTQLSSLGLQLGKKISNLIISGSGTAMTFLLAVGLLIIGHFMRHSHPDITKYLNVIVVMTLLQSVLYALTAFLPGQSSSNDFLSLWSGGIHPLVSIAFIVLVPIIIKLILVGIEKLAASCCQESAI